MSKDYKRPEPKSRGSGSSLLIGILIGLVLGLGIALAVAFIRAFARRSAKTVGNFWVDLTRCTLYILLPICIVYALFLVWQGMPQTLGSYVDATTIEGAKQTIQSVKTAVEDAKAAKMAVKGGR